MGQVKIYGLASHLQGEQNAISEVIHSCMMEVLQLPAEKRFHRYFLLERENFFFPPDRTEQYTIVEISIFEGRNQATKRQLLKEIMARFVHQLNFKVADVEVLLIESPRMHWGIRGQVADELNLDYKVSV